MASIELWRNYAYASIEEKRKIIDAATAEELDLLVFSCESFKAVCATSCEIQQIYSCVVQIIPTHMEISSPN